MINIQHESCHNVCFNISTYYLIIFIIITTLSVFKNLFTGVDQHMKLEGISISTMIVLMCYPQNCDVR